MRKKIVLIAVTVLALAGLAGAVWYFLKTGETLSNGEAGCPDPFVFQLPIDINLATSILYPGQYRGGEYKPHGGFRFDHSQPDEITVSAPYNAELFAGARYTVGEGGEVQYTLDFMHPCGVWYRFNHLRILTPKFQAIAETFPMRVGDSRTTEVQPRIIVKQGEVIATAVGMFSYMGKVNTFVDWGIFDNRQKNEASQDPAWLAKHSQYEIEQYAVCWFDWLSAEDEARVRALPSSDYQSGKTSDYCK